MVNYIRDNEDFSSLVTTTLAIAVIVLLGVIGYAYYTKDITPKNAIVKFFTSENITFNDLPLSEQNRYVLKGNTLEVLEPVEVEVSENENNELVEEVVPESVPNKFLEKMAKMQKETDEMVIDGKAPPSLSKEESIVKEEQESSNRFLEKMAKMQKDTDEMVIEGKSESSIIEEESEPKNKFLEKMAKMQKDTDEMVIEGKSKEPVIKEKSAQNKFLEKMAKKQKEKDEMIIKSGDNY